MLLVMKEVRTLEVRIPLCIASADRADVDCGVNMAECGIGCIFDERAIQAVEAAFYARDHHVFNFELRAGVCRINLPGNDGVCCGRHCSPSFEKYWVLICFAATRHCFDLVPLSRAVVGDRVWPAQITAGTIARVLLSGVDQAFFAKQLKSESCSEFRIVSAHS